MAITQVYALTMDNQGIAPVVHLSQYDSAGKQLLFKLYAGSTKYNIPTGSTVTIRGGKPDGTIYEYNAAYSDNEVTATVTSQMTAISGFHEAEVRIYSGTTVSGSANLRFAVEKSPFQESYKVSASELPIIENAEGQALNARDSANAALNSQNAASSSASQAESSATAASKSASAASASEAAAKTSETNAAASASAAAQSEKNAMSATPDGYQELASTFNSLGLYVDEDGDICQKD